MWNLSKKLRKHGTRHLAFRATSLIWLRKKQISTNNLIDCIYAQLWCVLENRPKRLIKEKDKSKEFESGAKRIKSHTVYGMRLSLTSSFNSRNFKFPNSLKCFEHETKSIARLCLYVKGHKKIHKKCQPMPGNVSRFQSWTGWLMMIVFDNNCLLKLFS